MEYLIFIAGVVSGSVLSFMFVLAQILNKSLLKQNKSKNKFAFDVDL